MRPPFELSPRALACLSAIERLVGRLEGLQATVPQPRLRKHNRIRTVHGSVGIEGNTLSIEQVTALLDGARVLGPPREILEVQNALAAYDLVPRLRAFSVRDLLQAHRLLMRGLIEDAGRFRAGSVGVLHGTEVAHVAPPARRVPGLVAGLFGWARKSPLPGVVKAAVVHYELLFIHPFTDGNGRIARLWQHRVLLCASPAFAFAPVESVVRDRQREYYSVLRRCDQEGASTAFVDFSLDALRVALEELDEASRPAPQSAGDRLELARASFASRWFGRGEYLELHKRMSTATASRDLRWGHEQGLLERRGERRLALYRFGRAARSGRRAQANRMR